MGTLTADIWKSVPSEPSFGLFNTPEFGVPKEEQYKVLQDVSKAHVESFNYMLREGLSKTVKHIQPMELELPSGERIKVEIKDCSIGVPVVHKDSVNVRNYKVYPSECRARGVTYKGKLLINVTWSKNGIPQDCVERVVGEVPVMVKSNICNLNKLKPKQLIERGEEEEEFGGYFIINGNERIVRMLIMQRRNYPIAMVRPSWKNRGQMFTEYGVSIRCVRDDQSGVNMVLHYLNNGSAQLMFAYRKELFFVPVMFVMKALCDVSDHFIYTEIIKGKEDDHFFKSCIASMLRDMQDEGLFTHNQIKQFIGEKFRVRTGLPSWYTDVQIAEFLFKDCICVHLTNDIDKFNLLAFMIRKLFAVAKHECAIESPDNPMNHELLLSGHLYTLVIKEKLESWLFYVRAQLDRRAKAKDRSFSVTCAFMNECFSNSMDLTRSVEYVFATGNFISRTGAGLMQFSGLTVVADKLNFWRYLSHFRCVHRGSFFAEMRTTTVRKLLPESWGFVCPVHTPDGAPCGLLNHLTAMCQVTNTNPSTSDLECILTALGMFSVSVPLPMTARECYPVLLNGKFLGWVPKHMGTTLVNKLRCYKALGKEQIPSMMEICLVPITDVASQYPGIFLFTTPARMMRPVRNLSTKTIEFIGSMEQVYLNICITADEALSGITTHQELRKTSMLSILANFIPYSDFNQSPRNMYECQMGKQTMGTPCYAHKKRSDNKLYRIQTPQSPLVKPAMHDFYHMDDYPLGTNAVVAVISYTGYDMEDAMIMNKASLERGFKHGSIYKSEFVNLRSISGERGSHVAYMFGRKETDTHLADFVDMDGLPYIGKKVNFDDPICSYIDLATGDTRQEKYHSTDTAYVMDVKLLGNDSGTDELQKICITFWIPRNPIIGDKFASRHGQKGICSMKFPAEDMPFTESGMTPDIIFNPHGFPSRMTIGMMIESMAGKSSALHGVAHDCTPFRFSEKDTGSEYFGELLKAAGYNYYGTEKMYSGTSGKELVADIFMGIVYYQRLRHMVADKYQVRTTGPVDILTHQPVQGRKRAGGIRFGEMERDSLLAHGASFLLHDRLFNCSDGSIAYVCMKCESILSPYFEKPPPENLPTSQVVRRDWTCKLCESKKNIEVISVPYVFRYLAAELAGINIKLKLRIS